jgi:thiol-disulfide isomerase/thioredoxin
MIKHFLVLLLVLLGLRPLFALPTELSGKVLSSTERNLSLHYIADHISFEAYVYTVPIEADGSFKFRFELDQVKRYRLQLGYQEYHILLFPGDEVQLTIQSNSNKAQFQPSGASKQQFWHEWSVLALGIEQRINEHIGNYDATAFQRLVNELSINFNRLQQTHYPKLEADFLAFARNDLSYRMAYHLLRYRWEYALANGMDDAVALPISYDVYFESLQLDYPLAYASEYYSYTLGALKDYMPELLNSPMPRFFLEASEYYFDIRRDPDIITAQHDKFMAECPFESLKTLLRQSRERMSVAAPGQLLPHMDILDAQGNIVSINSFKGQLVYIDFWASWCGACLKEMPHTQRLQEVLKGKNVVFLYISLDASTEEWKKHLGKHKPGGQQYFLLQGWGSEGAGKLGFSAIPHYMLIDQYGRVIASPAPRPSAYDESLQLILKHL